MRIGRTVLPVAAALATSQAGAQARTEFFVDQRIGRDANDGRTPRTAFRTVERARQAVDRANDAMRGDIVVHLSGGRHRLTQTLALGPDDGGTGTHRVVYRSRRSDDPAILSGGVELTGGWTDGDGDGVFEAVVPRGTASRNLYVAGRAATLARYGRRLTDVRVTDEGLETSDATLAGLKHPTLLEFAWARDWKWKIFSAQAVRAQGGRTTVVMKQPGWSRRSGGMQGIENDPGTGVEAKNAAATPDFVQNAIEFLDQPGEWFLDPTAGEVHYKPRPGEDMRTVDAVLAVVENELLVVEGTPDRPVEGIEFHDVGFEHATFLRPGKGAGHPGQQSNTTPDPSLGVNRLKPSEASVLVRYARRIRFDRCRFRDSGVAGLFFDRGSQDSAVVGSLFERLGSNGIQVGHLGNPEVAARVRGILVANNHIHGVGAEMRTAAQGVHVGFASEVRVLHNELHDLGYSGIALGMSWGDKVGEFGNHRVIGNRIWDFLKDGRDGAGIYNLGYAGYTGNSVVADNHVHDPHHDFGGLYSDEGSSYITWERNLVERTAGHRWFFDNSNAKGVTNKELVVRDNFTDNPATRISGTLVITGTTVFAPGKRPPAAERIAAGAGLEPAYRDIVPAHDRAEGRR